MSSCRKASVLAYVARRQRYAWFRCGLENDIALIALGDKLRYMSTNINSTRSYDETSGTRRNRTSLEQTINGIEKKDPDQKRGIFPPESNGEMPVRVSLQAPKDENTSITYSVEDVQSSHTSPSELTFTGDTSIPVTSHLHIVTPEEDTPRGVWPIFRIMDEDGIFRDGKKDAYYHDEILDVENSSTRIHETGTTINEETDMNNPDHSLATFRASLCKKYPNHSSEIRKIALLFPSKLQYADTNSKDTLKRLLRHMVRLREMDAIFQNAQRQGRISFYLTCRGEEGIHFGAASALEDQDVILGQYREQGPLMWRGFTLQQFSDQCFSNESDLGKGRQMPIHYGSRALNYQTISSPLGTQIPQAVGVALRLKLSVAEAVDAEAGSDNQKKAIAICFFGEGCTSTTDFHSGLNFAATLKCPVLFFCRNNGYAISTSVKEQYASDGVVSKAPGYGMAGIRVDGNDVFAVHLAVREARAYALENNAPVLIEAMSYRQGHHSTSDDSSQYRSIEEVEHFAQNCDPLLRLKNFFKHHEYDDTTDETIESIVEEEKKAILDAMRKAERKPKPRVEELFTDVYKEMPPSLESQKNKLAEHMAKYPDSYTM